jgi:hypothetical protein
MNRIIMIGPNGQRDYVEKILTGGCPCLCGNNPKFAGLYSDPQKDRIMGNLKDCWLHPHIDVISEEIETDEA